MGTLSVASPTLTTEILLVLPADGKDELASLLVNTEVLNCTFDDDCQAGYIYLRRPPYPVPETHNEAADVKYTVGYPDPHSFNIDIDHDGNAFGVEFIGRGDIAAELRHSGAL